MKGTHECKMAAYNFCWWLFLKSWRLDVVQINRNNNNPALESLYYSLFLHHIPYKCNFKVFTACGIWQEDKWFTNRYYIKKEWTRKCKPSFSSLIEKAEAESVQLKLPD